MNKLGNIKPPGGSSQTIGQATNPFARALAETEKSSYSHTKPPQAGDNQLLSEVLAQAGGQISPDTDPEKLQQQRAQLEAERKKQEMRKKLHDQVNPVNQKDIFNAQKIRTQKEIEEVRKELKKLAAEIKKFHKEVDIAITQNVVPQGTEGIGLKSFFDKLKSFIILLTQQVRSTQTWMQQHQAKAKKKKRKVHGGVIMEGGKAESKAVFDMMHHERSSAYSG